MSDAKEAHLQTLKKQWRQLLITSNEYHDRKLIVEHIAHNDGSATWMLARTLNQPTDKVRRVMREMEAAEIVELHSFTTPNNLVWKLTRPTE
jgi:hypothetical protein